MNNYQVFYAIESLDHYQEYGLDGVMIVPGESPEEARDQFIGSLLEKGINVEILEIRPIEDLAGFLERIRARD